MPVCLWYRSCSMFDVIIKQSFESLYAFAPSKLYPVAPAQCADGTVRRRAHGETAVERACALCAPWALTVEHRDRVLRARLEAVELLEVGNRVDTAAAHRVVVASHRADQDNARLACGGQVVEEQRDLRGRVSIRRRRG